jgi:iron complex outermembrane recepter protein
MQSILPLRPVGVLLLCACVRAALAAPLPLTKAQLAAAQSNEKTLDIIEIRAPRPEGGLNAKARTATRLKLTLLETPASVTVIDQAKLRALGETTAIEALENAPGVAPSYIFGVLALSGRGFSGVFNSPTLFDGIRYPGWQVTPRLTLNYDHIEVLGGPAALSAGQGSIGGAVNLVPRRADGVTSQSAYLSFGRFGTATQGYGVGGALGKSAVNYRLDISHQSSDERGSFGYAKDTSFEFFHINTDIAATLSDDIAVGLSLEAFRDRAEGYFGSPLVNRRLDLSLRDRNFNVADDAVDMNVRWARARLEWQPSDTLSGRVMLYANGEDRLFRNAEVYSYSPATNSVTRGDFLNITHDQQLLGGYAELSWQHTLFGHEHQLVTGIQMDRNDHDRSSNSPFRFTEQVQLATLPGSFRSIDLLGPRTATLNSARHSPKVG